MGSMQWARGKRTVAAYGKARRAFRKAQEEMPDLLGGNDNKVGVCGEFWAKKYYAGRGYVISEVPASNNEGYDFRCRRGHKALRVSVKVVTKESRTGRQLRLKRSEKWDELCMVLLDEDLSPYCHGRATRAQFNRAVREKAISSSPHISRSSCNQKGWIATYGTVEWLKKSGKNQTRR